MAKGPKITSEVIKCIAEVYYHYPELRAKEVQREVNSCLRKQNPRLNPDWPGLSAIQKELTKIRRRDEERTPESKELDRPWRVLDIARYPIPPETLPAVLETWARELLKDDPLTIREVLWISRLYYISQDRKDEVIWAVADDEEPLDDIGTATRSAKAYASDEIIYEITGNKPNKPDDMWWDWFHDGYLCEMKWGEAEIGEKTRQELEKRRYLIPPLTITEGEVQKRTYRGGTK